MTLVQVTKESVRDEQSLAYKRRLVRFVLAAWGALIGCFLLWQTLTYRGVTALVAEWQFNMFGRYYPSFTYILLAMLLGSPALWLLRAKPREADDEQRVPGRNLIRALLGIAVFFGGACLLVLIATWLLPRDGDAPRRLAIGSPSAAVPEIGATVLIGDVLRSQTAGLSQKMGVGKRTIRFAPVVAPETPAGDTDLPTVFFVEIGDTQPRNDTGQLRGVLRRGGLPGEIERLYRYAGIKVADPYYVLFISDESLRWPYRIAATQLTIISIACALIAALLHVRRERLRRRLRERSQTPT